MHEKIFIWVQLEDVYGAEPAWRDRDSKLKL